MKDYRPAKKRAAVTVGESVRILRELQESSQNQQAQASGIPQATLSAIENGRVRLGVERAIVLAQALECHPGVLVFAGWEMPGGKAHNKSFERAGVQSGSRLARQSRQWSFAQLRR